MLARKYRGSLQQGNLLKVAHHKKKRKRSEMNEEETRNNREEKIIQSSSIRAVKRVDFGLMKGRGK